MAALVVVQGRCAQSVYEVPREGDLTIGRSLQSALVLEDASVSRRHARVFLSGEDYVLEDLDSSNGTRVNGAYVTRRVLHPGDLVEIGPYRFRFETAVSEVRRREPAGAVILEDDRTAAPPAGPESDRPPESTGAAVLARVDTRKVAAAEVPADPESLRRKLRAFQAFVDAVGPLLDLDAILEKALESLFTIFTQTERAFVLLADPETGELVPRAVRNNTPDAGRGITVSRTIVEEAIREGKSILMADSASDARFGRAESVVNLKIRSAMCVPLVSSNRTYGIIYVDTTSSRARFTEDDLYLLAGIGAQAARAIENANLHARLVRNQVREHDLALASQVQRSFLPADVPALPGYDFFVHYSPAFEVGGDFYDFLELPQGRIAVVLGDVSGKGFSAALMMAKLISDLRHTAPTAPDPGAVLERLNRIVAQGAGDAFVTLLYLVLEPAAGVVTALNAGHMAPLVVHRGGDAVEEPGENSGLPLGVDPDTRYRPDRFRLDPGDSVILYTDGISEARNGSGRYYGLERLRRCVLEGPPGAADLAGHLLDDVRRFVGDTVQSDDITLVGFGRSL